MNTLAAASGSHGLDASALRVKVAPRIGKTARSQEVDHALDERLAGLDTRLGACNLFQA